MARSGVFVARNEKLRRFVRFKKFVKFKKFKKFKSLRWFKGLKVEHYVQIIDLVPCLLFIICFVKKNKIDKLKILPTL